MAAKKPHRFARQFAVLKKPDQLIFSGHTEDNQHQKIPQGNRQKRMPSTYQKMKIDGKRPVQNTKPNILYFTSNRPKRCKIAWLWPLGCNFSRNWKQLPETERDMKLNSTDDTQTSWKTNEKKRGDGLLTDSTSWDTVKLNTTKRIMRAKKFRQNLHPIASPLPSNFSALGWFDRNKC